MTRAKDAHSKQILITLKKQNKKTKKLPLTRTRDNTIIHIQNKQVVCEWVPSGQQSVRHCVAIVLFTLLTSTLTLNFKTATVCPGIRQPWYWRYCITGCCRWHQTLNLDRIKRFWTRKLWWRLQVSLRIKVHFFESPWLKKNAWRPSTTTSKPPPSKTQREVFTAMWTHLGCCLCSPR